MEFSTCTIAGPRRLGVGVGVSVGAALGPHPASRIKARPKTRTEKLFVFFIGSLSIRKGDSVARVIVWYVPSDASTRNAPESDPGRALPPPPHDGLAGRIAGPSGRLSYHVRRQASSAQC